MSYFPKDPTPTDASRNPVESNGVFDELALKAPLNNPWFTGTAVAPILTAYRLRNPGTVIDITSSQTCAPLCGEILKVNYLAGITLTITQANLVEGDEVFVAFYSYCPAGSLIFTDMFGTAITLSMVPSSKTYVMLKKVGAGFFYVKYT